MISWAERDIVLDDPELLADFIAQASELLPHLTPQAIERLAIAPAPSPIALSLHALRGTAGFFGLQGLCDAASTLERRLGDADASPAALAIEAARLAVRIELLRVRIISLPQPARASRTARFGDLVPGLQRVLDDCAALLGRRIRLSVEGHAARLAPAWLAPLRDALVQLLRNAADHGIEPPGERRALGKPETGQLVLRATHAGDMLFIALEDDGRGVVADRAPHPSPVSGLGLGLDIVRHALAPLDGEVELHSSPGRGTRAMLRIPHARLALADDCPEVSSSCLETQDPFSGRRSRRRNPAPPARSSRAATPAPP